jgi:hypothetical protein
MTTPERVALKTLQLAVSVGFLGLLWQIYPGITGGVLGLGYVAVSTAAMLGSRVGTLAAFAFTAIAGAFAWWGVYRYLDNGFGFLSGNFDGRTGIHWPAYLFLFVATGAATVIALQLMAWRSGAHASDLTA